MITLDQVQMLEKKVEMIVSKINELQKQNSALQQKNRELIEKNSLLMQKVSSFEADQNKIEKGILNALDRLSCMESTVLNVGSSATNEQEESSTVQNFNQEENQEKPQEYSTSQEENQNSNLTDFSNIPETESNYTEENIEDKSPELVFTEEILESNQETETQPQEQSLDFGLDLDFDSSTEDSQEDSQQQLGIY